MPVRSLVESFYDQLWNRVDLAVASVILHPDVSLRGSVGVGAVGRAEVCGDLASLRAQLDRAV